MTDGATKSFDGDFFSFTLSLDTPEKATDVFNKLADGGEVISPLAPQFWAELCGDVKDRFGVSWYIIFYGN